MIPDLEKRLRGGPHTYSFLLGMGNELTERRKKPRCKTSPAKKSGKPKPPIAQTPQNRLRGLAPGPITKITRPPRRRRPPSTPSTSSSQQQRVQELLGQHVSNVPTNSPPTFGMPVGGPDTRPPPIPLPQVPIPMGQTWPTTQFFRGGKETGEVPGCYTRSVEHTIISWGLAGLAGGNIEPMPPSRGPGYQTRLELVLAGDTADDDGRVLIQFLAQISDVMEGTDYCIGLSLLRKVEANKGSLDSSSKPSASSSFSDVNQGMVTGECCSRADEAGPSCARLTNVPAIKRYDTATDNNNLQRRTPGHRATSRWYEPPQYLIRHPWRRRRHDVHGPSPATSCTPAFCSPHGWVWVGRKRLVLVRTTAEWPRPYERDGTIQLRPELRRQRPHLGSNRRLRNTFSIRSGRSPVVLPLS